MPTIYCAGPITGKSFCGATDWYDDLRIELNKHPLGREIELAKPMRGKDYLRQEIELSDNYAQHAMSTAQAILTRDFNDVANCDLVVMNVLGADRVSIGTVMEMGFAYSLRTPVVWLIEEEGNIHEHAMMVAAASTRVTSIEEGAFVAATLLAPYC